MGKRLRPAPVAPTNIIYTYFIHLVSTRTTFYPSLFMCGSLHFDVFFSIPFFILYHIRYIHFVNKFIGKASNYKFRTEH